MKRAGIWSVLKYLGVLLFAKSVPAPQGLKDMVRRRLDAMASNDMEAYNATTLPESLALVNERTRPAMEWMTGKDFGRKVPPDFKLNVLVIGPRDELLLDEWLDYPERPTHAVKIVYRTQPGNYTTLIWHVLEKAGQWYVLVPAPDLSKPAVNQMLQKTLGEKSLDGKKIEELYFRADPGELSKLREMLRMGQKMTAVDRCRTKLGLDLAAAKSFVELVQTRS